jgi:hypothetical protein
MSPLTTENRMKTFDPYRDRLARDIRNGLSSALVKAISGKAAGSLSRQADVWLAKAPAPSYQTYIQTRMGLYARALDEIRALQMLDPRNQALCLWNLGLFFEMHELLETVWLHSRDPERSALKGLIQAAGAYVHLQRGERTAAQRLAKRAVTHLRNGRSCLAFIANLDELIEALAGPAASAPTLLPA